MAEEAPREGEMAEQAKVPGEQVRLREVADSDLPVFFEHQREPEGRYMAAFTPRDANDRAAFDAHWAKIRADPEITLRTIVVDGQVVGSISSFQWQERLEVGYWLGREYWGKGIATRALAQFLDVVKIRPIYANAAADNSGSIRVLEKCGFRQIGLERGFAQARGAEIDEVVMELK